jgi:hypothetical protein
VLSGEATNTNFIVFALTRSGLEPTIYGTQGEHANHYTTDAVPMLCFQYVVFNSINQTCSGILFKMKFKQIISGNN